MIRILPLLLLAAAAAAAVPCARADDGAAPATVAWDTVTTIDEMVVTGRQAPSTQPDRMRIETPVIEVRDPASLADLGRLIPSARVSTNSRGDSHLMIRGAPERHVQTFLDDIPLNLPWDERVDLRTIPITGTATLSGTRGLTTLLDGPGVLAGSMRILPARAADGPTTRLGVRLGAMGREHADVQHRRRVGSWDLTGAGSWYAQEAFPVPGTGDRRFNSDLEQWSVLLRGSRPVAGAGRLNLMATGWSAELGVPPETHLGPDARFWRYPARRRGLVGASLDVPLDEAETWDLKTAVSADFHEQEIDPRGPDRWGAPLEEGEDYEWDEDRTGFGNVRLTRWLGHGARVAVQATGRYTRHTEILTVGGPSRAYSQWLTSLAAEADLHLNHAWILRGGLAWDHAATPESGDKRKNGAQDDPAWNLRATRELGAGSRVYAAASRRSRFPSLRELYSGALGRFVPNPGLRPERQQLYELGAAASPGAFELEAGLFLNYLEDGIERVALNNPERQFQRVNRTEIRVPGLELVGRWRAATDLSVVAQHTVMEARVKEGGGFDRPAEDRPDYLSRLAGDWRPLDGPGAMVEAVVTGGRWSADASGASAEAGGLARLPAGVVWNARVSWRFVHPQTTVDLHLRLDNVFDRSVPHQIGLTNPGRLLSGGALIDF